ncbi:PhoH family protein [Escherichia coli]|nr:PhoH family protein [Escherichia coli]
MSTRREVILSWLREKRQTWRLCYLLGEAGSGKTWLAQQLQKDKHRRVITLSLVVSSQGKAAWIVTDDNAAEQGCVTAPGREMRWRVNYCMRFIELIVAALLLLLKMLT